MTAVTHGGLYLSAQLDPTNGMHYPIGIWLVGLMAVVGGLALLIGFMTPVAGALVGIGCLMLALSGLPPPTPSLLHDRLDTLLVVIMAGVATLVGPGRWSFDAYLFGRREIIIPRGSNPSE